MGWASRIIAQLRTGETVEFRPRGNSMSGKIESGELVTVEPIDPNSIRDLRIGDVVLCNVRGSQYLHLITGIRRSGETPISFQIGNNKGKINGWAPAKNIYGKCIRTAP